MAKTKILWTLGLIKHTFHLKSLDYETHSLMQEWLSATSVFTDLEQIELESLRKDLFLNAENWEEEDLKMFFIAFIIRMANYRGENYRPFFEKLISATVETHELSSKPDMMVVKAEEDYLMTPYFCFHEYKKSKPEGDPRCQLLIDMLIAQELNHNEHPIYGAYVIGKYWTFVILAGKEYVMSSSFDATDKQMLPKIVHILRHLNRVIEKWGG